MKKLSLSLLADTIISRRKALKMTQTDLAKKTGMNRSVLSKLETQDYTPSIDQLQAIAECLGFEPTELFIDSETHPFSAHSATAAKGTAQADTSAATDATETNTLKPYNIAVAGTGYVGLSLAVLLAQNHEVTAITTTPAKADKLNKFISPIQDEEIERFFREVNAGERTLHLHTTVDKEAAYSSADLVIIAMNV